MGLKLVVIDDQEEVVDLLRLLLEPTFPEGLVTFTDPLMAAAHLAQHRVHGVLLDVEMPGIDGFEMISNIRESVLNSRIPIAMITGEAPTATRERAFGLGATAMLCKPFTFEQVIALGSVLKAMMRHEAVKGLRLPLRLAVVASQKQHELARGHTLTVGDGGAVVHLNLVLRVETQIDLEFTLPDDPVPLWVAAHVGGAAGGGSLRIIFDEFAGDGRERLRDYLARQLTS